MKTARWIVSQISARQHYAVPRAFHECDRLDTFYTDAWCRYGASFLRHAAGPARALAGRHHPDLPSRKVVSFTLQSVLDTLSAPRAQSMDQKYREFIRVGEAFSRKVNKDLQRRDLRSEEHAFFGFDTGCLETLRMMSTRGITSIVDQIDTARVEQGIVSAEVQKWPGWQELPGTVPEAYYERLSNEWRTATLVLVNSKWTQTALIEQGVPVEKIIVVPQAYEPPQAELPGRARDKKGLSVLWLGSVSLIKGIQYLISAARLLENTDVRFLVAGGISISADAVAAAPANMSFLGRVPRADTSALFAQADVFVQPTLSDGFAITQLEAMAHGLPVVTTPNCGDVVTHGEDGFVVPAGDEFALATAISTLDADRNLVQEMSQRALVKSRAFTLKRYAAQVNAAVAASCPGFKVRDFT